MLDFTSTKTQILLNPHLPEQVQRELKESLEGEGALKDHFWFQTSGSTGQIKCVALSKGALMASAAAVNTHLEVHSTDRWLHVLPDFHVGGVGIWARAYLTHSSVIKLENKWQPQAFVTALETHDISWTALVPTQLYDLVQQRLPAVKSLRGVIIGGGALPQLLYDQARQLGWPLLPSYGLTECASQVATATGESAQLTLLSHIEAKVDEQDILSIKSPALLTTYAFLQRGKTVFIDPKAAGWFQTADRVVIGPQGLIVKGRRDDLVKISGEGVDIARLQALLDGLLIKKNIKGDCALIALPHPRLGAAIHLAYSGLLLAEAEQVQQEFNQRVMPFERIHQRHAVTQIPRTVLGKLLKKKLANNLSFGFIS